MRNDLKLCDVLITRHSEVGEIALATIGDKTRYDFTNGYALRIQVLLMTLSNKKASIYDLTACKRFVSSR